MSEALSDGLLLFIMNNTIRCPKCSGQQLEGGRSLLIRDEFVDYFGKCLTCGHEINVDDVLEQLRRKFDFEKELEILEAPLENVLAKAQTEHQEETRKRMLELLIEIYEYKARQNSNDTEVEKYVYKKISCEQALAGRKFTENELMYYFANFYVDKNQAKALEYLKKAESIIAPTTSKEFKVILDIYTRRHEWEQAIRNLEALFEAKCSEIEQIFEPTNFVEPTAYQNLDVSKKIKVKESLDSLKNAAYQKLEWDYLVAKVLLLFQKEGYKEALDCLKKLEILWESYQAFILTSAGYSEESKGKVNDTSLLSQDGHKESSVWIKEQMIKALVMIGDYHEATRIFNSIPLLNPDYVIDPEEDPFYFVSLVKTLIEIDMLTALHLMKTMNPSQFSNDIALFAHFLKGQVLLKYYFETNNEDKTLLTEAKEAFNSVLTIHRSNTLDESMSDFLANCLEPLDPKIWESLFGPIERVLPDTYTCLGKIFNELGLEEEAIVSFKKVEEWKKYSKEHDIHERIKEIRIKLGRREAKLLEEKMNELQKGLGLFSLPEPDEKIAKRILFNLKSIMEQLSEIEEQLTEIKELIPKIRNYVDNWQKVGFEISDVLHDCRKIIESLFDKVCEKAEKKHPGIVPKVIYKDSKPSKPGFNDKIIALRRKEVINAYIGRLFSLVWDVGGKSGHTKPSLSWVEKLEIEDVEVIVSSVVRILNWYIKNYRNRLDEKELGT